MSSSVRNILFGSAGICLLLGAILYLSKIAVAPYLFAVGAAGILVCHLTLPTENMEFRQKRLHRFNIIAGILMVISSAFMFKGKTEWVLFLSIAAIFQLYAAFVGGKKQ